MILLSTTTDAQAQRRAPEFSLPGTSGTVRQLRQFSGRVVILVYEDQGSSNQNNALKNELAQRARQGRFNSQVALLPIADLRGYNFWPAQGYAEDAVRQIARQQNVEILIDWTGAMPGAYNIVAGSSNVIVIGRDGNMLFHAAGSLNPAQRQQFFQVVESAIGPAPTTADSTPVQQ